MFVIGLLIKISSKGPVFYRQQRIGLNQKIFEIIKFRTMTHDAERATGPVLSNSGDNRITPVGRVLRKTRLDELPQLISVLKGEMSFIGPRPERSHIINELKQQIPYYLARLRVKPGVTGWAQVNLNYDRTIEDVRLKVQYDLYYIEGLHT